MLGRRKFSQLVLRRRRNGKRRIGPDDALADLLECFAGSHFWRRLEGLGKQCQANRLDAHPRLRVVLHHVPMLGEPERRGGGYLRRRGGGAGAIHVDDVGAIDLGPRYVRRVGAERRLHLLVRSVVSLHSAEAQPGIGAAVAHDAAGRQHAVVTRWEHDAFGRGNACKIVARRGDHDYAVVVSKVDCIGQRA